MQEHKVKVTGGKKSALLRPVNKHQNEERTPQSYFARDNDPLARVSCRLGDASCAAAHGSRLNRATSSPPARLLGDSLLRLQRQYGNFYVQRVLELARQAGGEAEVGPEVEQAIQNARGCGQALDSKVRTEMGSAFGVDFSAVRVHTDAQADTLNRAVNARAFTTGKDIFFRQGEYSPGSSSGRELIAHELTHVVQQNSDELQRKLTVSQPGDRYEKEADEVARTVLELERLKVPGEEEPGRVQRQVEEEEEDLQAKIEPAR
jgi:hypothetical protein